MTLIKFSVRFSFRLSLFSWIQFGATEIYERCGEKDKTCYGDIDGCIQTKNCSYVVTATENRTHYVAEIQNNCNAAEENVFFGIGVAALVKEV